MTTHILSMTYQPKIEGVRNGTIRQTIRLYNPDRPFKVGDKLLIHGWEGKPYRSRWNWRLSVEVNQLVPIRVCKSGVMDGNNRWRFYLWDASVIKRLAELDGVAKNRLKHVLERYHGKFTDKPVRFQVIRW